MAALGDPLGGAFSGELPPAHLVYRVSGQEMQRIAIDKDPKSCCAVERTSSGELKLANRCCCMNPNGAFFGIYEHQFCHGKHPQKGSLFTAELTAVLLQLPRFQSKTSEH